MKDNNNYAEAFEGLLKELDMSYELIEREEYTIFEMVMSADNASALRFHITFYEEGVFKIFCMLARNIDSSKYDAVLRTINELNSNYKFIKLSMHENDINANYNGLLFDDDKKTAGMIFSLFHILIHIIDDCIPPIMQTIWSSGSDEQSVKIKTDLFDLDDLEGADDE